MRYCLNLLAILDQQSHIVLEMYCSSALLYARADLFRRYGPGFGGPQ